MLRNSILITTSISVAALATACGGQTDDIAEIENQLGQSFGGLTETNEAPEFGEEQTFEDLDASDEPTAEDPTGDPNGEAAAAAVDTALGEAENESVPEAQRAIVYALFVSWGRKHLDMTATDRMVWDPTLRTDCGVIGVRRRLLLEDGEGVVRPRTDAQTVSFTSQTGPHRDGAWIMLAIPASERACTATGNLTFESTALPAPLVVPMDDALADTVLREEVGDNNVVAAYAHRVEPARSDDCVRGFLLGRWRRAIDDEGNVRDNIGRLYGRVINMRGELRGHVRGIYGSPKQGRFEGAQVFFGKYIDTAGTFKGLVAGRYGDGHFGGGWHMRPRFSDLRGKLEGRYTKAPNVEPDGGIFAARYASRGCSRPIDEPALADE